jgi:hypothetical protein
MKTISTALFFLFVVSVFAQKTKPEPIPQIRNLNHFLIVGKIDKPDDRYAVEVNLTRFMAQFGFHVLPSLNFSKVGNSSETLASDSLIRVLNEKGIHQQLLVSVRGYDKTFRPATNLPKNLKEALDRGHLFPLWQEQATSVTFEFSLYQDGLLAGYEIVKVSGISTRESVFTKLQARIEKLLGAWRSKK